MGDRSEPDGAKCDVAISFLAKDESVAAELSDQLAGLNVFFFPKNRRNLQVQMAWSPCGSHS